MDKEVNQNSVEFMFGQVLTRLEAIEHKVDDNHTEILGQVEKQGERLSKLERVKQWAVGGATVGASGGVTAWWHKIFGG